MNSVRCLFSKCRRGRSEDGKWEKPGLTLLVSVSRHRRCWFPSPGLSVPCWGPSGHHRNSEVNRPLSCLWPLLASLSFLFPPSRQQIQTPHPQTRHPPGHLARWRGSCLGLRAKGRGHGACQASRHKSPAPALRVGTSLVAAALSRAGWDFAARWVPGRLSPASSRCQASALLCRPRAEYRPAPFTFSQLGTREVLAVPAHGRLGLGKAGPAAWQPQGPLLLTRQAFACRV